MRCSDDTNRWWLWKGGDGAGERIKCSERSNKTLKGIKGHAALLRWFSSFWLVSGSIDTKTRYSLPSVEAGSTFLYLVGSYKMLAHAILWAVSHAIIRIREYVVFHRFIKLCVYSIKGRSYGSKALN